MWRETPPEGAQRWPLRAQCGTCSPAGAGSCGLWSVCALEGACPGACAARVTCRRCGVAVGVLAMPISSVAWPACVRGALRWYLSYHDTRSRHHLRRPSRLRRRPSVHDSRYGTMQRSHRPKNKSFVSHSASSSRPLLLGASSAGPQRFAAPSASWRSRSRSSHDAIEPPRVGTRDSTAL